MKPLRRLAASVIGLLRTVPAVNHWYARTRSRLYERQVAGFIRDGSGRADRFPHGIVYESTMRCNLHCEFCYVGDLLNIEGEWREEMPLEVIRRAFPERDGLQVNLTGGEIFMRKDIMEVLELFAQKKYVCGYLTTNGTIIDDERAEALADLALRGFLKHISVSIDGPGELHDAARGVKGTFERTAAGLRRLQEAARRKAAPLRVSINTTVAAESLASLHAMVEVAEELGVDAIGLNHLMFATPEEAEQTAKILGAPDTSVIATFVTPDPGLDAAAGGGPGAGTAGEVPRAGRAVRLQAESLADHHRELLPPGHAAARPVSVSVPARPGRLQRQGVLLPVHPHRGRRPEHLVDRGGLEQPRATWNCASCSSNGSCSRCAGGAARWSCRREPVPAADIQPRRRRMIALTPVAARERPPQ